ncbi:MAG: helix-turn-helix transcriptional regulator [Syntrophomonas sp.]
MIGWRIKELRKGMGMSQKELALLIGKPSHVVCKIEKGKRRVTGDEIRA